MTSVAENNTVSPSDSASQNGVPGSDMQVGDLGSSVGSIVTSLPAAYATMDKASYQQYVSVAQLGLSTLNRAVGYQCSAARVASSSVSGSSSSSNGSSGLSASRSVGGKYARLASLKSMKSWRPASVPDGLCYTKLLKGTEAEGRAVDLQQWPALASLLKLPASAFQSFDELERFRVVGDSTSVHVRAGGDGSSFLQAASRVAQGLKTAPGTFGAVLRASAVQPGCSVKLSARTMVGGTAVLPFVQPGLRSSFPATDSQAFEFDSLFSMPASWFLPLSATNSLWLVANGKDHSFSLRGTIHFNSYLAAIARQSCWQFEKGEWGFELAGADVSKFGVSSPGFSFSPGCLSCGWTGVAPFSYRIVVGLRSVSAPSTFRTDAAEFCFGSREKAPVGCLDLRGVCSRPPGAFDVTSSMLGGKLRGGFPDGNVRRLWTSMPFPFPTEGVPLSLDMGVLTPSSRVALLDSVSGFNAVWDGGSWVGVDRGVVLSSGSVFSFKLDKDLYSLWLSLVVDKDFTSLSVKHDL